jgi:hypothetical protein
VNRESHQVPRPPKLRRVYEPAPTIHPPLRGMPDWPGPPLDEEPETFEHERTEGLDDLAARALEAARDDERVREHLGDGRHEWLGASVREDKEREAPLALAVAFDYDRNVAVEVVLEGTGESLRVASVGDAGYHPPPSEGEVRRATELARGDRRVSGRLSEDLESTAILVSDVEQGDRHHGARRIEIGFSHPEERLPRIRALVDLTEERVLGVHADDGPREEYPEERS